MLRIQIYKLYFQVGSVRAPSDVTFVAGDTVVKKEGFIYSDETVFEFTMPSPGMEVVVQHSQLTSVGFRVTNYWPDGTEEPPVLTTFKEVSITVKKSGECPVCHGTASRSKKFFQTISPFNRTADNQVKTEDQIYEELLAKSAAWKLEPTLHAKCE